MTVERYGKYLEGSDYKLISGIIPLSGRTEENYGNSHSRQQVCKRNFEYGIQCKNVGNSPTNCGDEFIELSRYFAVFGSMTCWYHGGLS
jgi:hypothetical protein